jgi:hypothetical protein
MTIGQYRTRPVSISVVQASTVTLSVTRETLELPTIELPTSQLENTRIFIETGQIPNTSDINMLDQQNTS